jgi:hypothetical protein
MNVNSKSFKKQEVDQRGWLVAAANWQGGAKGAARRA